LRQFGCKNVYLNLNNVPKAKPRNGEAEPAKVVNGLEVVSDFMPATYDLESGTISASQSRNQHDMGIIRVFLITRDMNCYVCLKDGSQFNVPVQRAEVGGEFAPGWKVHFVHETVLHELAIWRRELPEGTRIQWQHAQAPHRRTRQGAARRQRYDHDKPLI
jgi:hypothetical protein